MATIVLVSCNDSAHTDPSENVNLGRYGVPEQIEDNDTQEAYWELQKFLVLALKANPNILECLHTPLIEDLLVRVRLASLGPSC